MLIQFSVTNYRSIKDTATISMLAGVDSSHEEDLVVLDNTRRLLPVATIYGANAAGKSNILLAFHTMLDMITGKNAQLLKDKKLPYDPFRFTINSDINPTEFGVIYYYNNIKYAYNFSYNEKQIVSESLYHWPNGREALIFSRSNDKYKFSENQNEQSQLSSRTPPNKLYIVSSNEWNLQQTESAYKWFTEKLNLNEDQNTPDATINAIKDIPNNSLRQKIINEFCLADLGIVDVGVTEKDAVDNDKAVVIMVHKTHINSENAKFALPLEQESKGTQKFFSRIGPWVQALETGSVIIIDELESSMHPLLTRRLVEMIQDANINVNHAQLIFTTHDTMLLDLSLLRRDQIWFADKDPETLSTELFSLGDFSVRKNENIHKGYLQGRYGAIPFLGGDIPCQE